MRRSRLRCTSSASRAKLQAAKPTAGSRKKVASVAARRIRNDRARLRQRELRAVRAVASGGVYLDPSIAGHALAETSGSDGRPGATEGREPLSPREAETLRLIAQGFSNKEIARRIDVSVKSVETYKARAAEKLGLKTRAEIIRYGAAHGWFDALALR